MTYERFEWLEIPDERTQQKKKTSELEEALIGKRCPECGWLDEETGEYRGRPMDIAFLPDGSMLVSDDFAGAIWRIAYTGGE